MYTADKEDQLLGGNPDFVLDAIDNIDTKVRIFAVYVLLIFGRVRNPLLGELLGGNPDFVLDAIDDIDTKV